jgi:hypothetical protein
MSLMFAKQFSEGGGGGGSRSKGKSKGLMGKGKNHHGGRSNPADGSDALIMDGTEDPDKYAFPGKTEQP